MTVETTTVDLALIITDRLKAELEGLPGERVRVHRGLPPTRPPGPWVALYFNGGNARPVSLASWHRAVRWTFAAACGGYSDTEALRVVDQVRNALTGWRPVPLDRSFGQVNEVPTDPPLLRDPSSASNDRLLRDSLNSQTDNRYTITPTFAVAVTRKVPYINA